MSGTCPSCGYCPHCGRGGVYVKPWYINYDPFWVQPYTISITSVGTQAGDSKGTSPVNGHLPDVP